MPAALPSALNMRIPLFVGLLAFACSALAEDLASLRERALADDTAYQLVESLTTEVGQRLAGSPADARAVAWTIARFKSLGYDRVYTEPVSYPVWERGIEGCEVLAPFPQQLSITALGGSRGTAEDGVSGEVLAFADLAAVKAALPGSAQGKIVFIHKRMQRHKTGSGYSEAVGARVEGASAAARIGAAALLIRSIGTDEGTRSAHTGVMRYSDPAVAIPAAALANVDADLLLAMLERGKPVQVKLTLGAKTQVAEYVGSNVIGEITGSKWPKQVVVIGGHLDSWDLGTGAIDDATGVAITMAAGALIGAQPSPPKRTIRVIAWANEEQGVYGGKAYAAAHKAQVKQHVIAAESDFGTGRVYQLSTALPKTSLGKLDPLYAALAPLGIARGTNEARGGADVGPLRELGVPVAELSQDGTNYFDIHHTENDTLDKVDREALKQNVAAYALFARFFGDW